ncbi:hypothetical protein V502_10288 [Pseudogymnoascus sp. VKM F-4520 (FW-2644)]|nr:hypothetical protein V502_10288 [Pseudogymnoascus sp. VKM F-4520 (FW-2644)]
MTLDGGATTRDQALTRFDKECPFLGATGHFLSYLSLLSIPKHNQTHAYFVWFTVAYYGLIWSVMVYYAEYSKMEAGPGPGPGPGPG